MGLPQETHALQQQFLANRGIVGVRLHRGDT